MCKINSPMIRSSITCNDTITQVPFGLCWLRLFPNSILIFGPSCSVLAIVKIENCQEKGVAILHHEKKSISYLIFCPL